MKKRAYLLSFLLGIAIFTAVRFFSERVGWSGKANAVVLEGIAASVILAAIAGIACLALFLYGLRLKFRVAAISATRDPDEKISRIDQFIHQRSILRNLLFPMTNPSQAALKVSLLNMAAEAYMVKEDYKSAMARVNEAKALFAAMGDVKIKDPMDSRELCLLIECRCMANMGRIDEAAQQMSCILASLDPAREGAVGAALAARAEMAICAKDAANARKFVDQSLPIMKKLADQYQNQDIYYEGMLMDGIVDGMEGDTDGAKRKLREAADHSSNYGDKRRAEKELSRLTGGLGSETASGI